MNFSVHRQAGSALVWVLFLQDRCPPGAVPTPGSTPLPSPAFSLGFFGCLCWEQPLGWHGVGVL